MATDSAIAKPVADICDKEKTTEVDTGTTEPPPKNAGKKHDRANDSTGVPSESSSPQKKVRTEASPPKTDVSVAPSAPTSQKLISQFLNPLASAATATATATTATSATAASSSSSASNMKTEETVVLQDSNEWLSCDQLSFLLVAQLCLPLRLKHIQLPAGVSVRVHYASNYNGVIEDLRRPKSTLCRCAKTPNMVVFQPMNICTGMDERGNQVINHWTMLVIDSRVGVKRVAYWDPRDPLKPVSKALVSELSRVYSGFDFMRYKMHLQDDGIECGTWVGYGMKRYLDCVVKGQRDFKLKFEPVPGRMVNIHDLSANNTTKQHSFDNRKFIRDFRVYSRNMILRFIDKGFLHTQDWSQNNFVGPLKAGLVVNLLDEEESVQT